MNIFKQNITYFNEQDSLVLSHLEDTGHSSSNNVLDRENVSFKRGVNEFSWKRVDHVLKSKRDGTEHWAGLIAICHHLTRPQSPHTHLQE